MPIPPRESELQPCVGCGTPSVNTNVLSEDPLCENCNINYRDALDAMHSEE